MATCDVITLDQREIYRGDSDKWTITFGTKAGDIFTPIDITGYEARFTARENFPDKSVINDDDAALSVVGVNTDPTNGKSEIELPPSQTKDLDIRNYYYDYQLKAPNGDPLTIGIGIFKVLNELTRG